MIISREYGPQFDPSDGTLGKLQLVRRWGLCRAETGLLWPAGQGRYTYADRPDAVKALEQVKTVNRADLYPADLTVMALWCYPGHYDPAGPCMDLEAKQDTSC